MLKNLVHLDIESERTVYHFVSYQFEHRTGQKISSLNKNLKYIRLSGPVNINIKGRGPCIFKAFQGHFLCQPLAASILEPLPVASVGGRTLRSGQYFSILKILDGRTPRGSP